MTLTIEKFDECLSYKTLPIYRKHSIWFAINPLTVDGTANKSRTLVEELFFF